jgi:hypothetical protein
MGEEDQKGAIPMDKKLLSDYIDACELIRETKQQIRRWEHDVYETGDIGKRWNKRK